MAIYKIRSLKTCNYFILIFIFTPILFLKLYDSLYYALPKLYFLFFVFALMLTEWLLYEKQKFKIVKQNKSIFMLLCFYAILLIISVIFSYNVEVSLMGRLYREEGIFALLLYLFMFSFSFRYLEINERMLKLIVVVATVLSIHGLMQYFGLDFIIADGVVKRPFSTFRNPNFFGTYLVLILPLATYLYVKNKKMLHLYGVSVFFIYLVLLSTYTRGAWVGAFVSFICFVIMHIRTKKNFKSLFKVFLVFGLATILFIIIDNNDFFARIMSVWTDAVKVFNQAENYDRAGSFRIFLWERVIQLIQRRPLIGYGPEALGDVFTDTYREEIISRFGYLMFDKAHNEYLHIAVSSGIPALLTYLVFIGTILKISYKNITENPLMIPIFSSVVGYLVQAFFNISIISAAHLFWIFLGALMYMATNEPENNKTDIELQ